MKFVIGGTAYPLVPLHQATLLEAADIKEQSKRSLPDLMRWRRELAGAPFATDPAAIFASPDHLVTMGVLVWLARQRAGEEISFKDAVSFAADDLVIELDPEELPDPPKARKRAAKKTPGSPGRKAAQPRSRGKGKD